jgi:hypothetical protein
MKKRGKVLVDPELPQWKKTFKKFNETYFIWLEEFIRKAIPWLVLILLFIILGEVSGWINGLYHNISGQESHFLHQVEEFVHHNHDMILFIDQVIILAFIIDLYFSYFKTPTFKLFIKRYFLDIIAVLPLGFLFQGAGAAGLGQIAQIGEEVALSQEITHVTAETEKGAKVLIEAERTAMIAGESEKGLKLASESEKSLKLAGEAEKAAKASKFTRASKTVTRLPRVVRLWRLKYFLRSLRLRKLSQFWEKKGGKN